MLEKNRISTANMSTEEWKEARIGKFTSSRIHELMGERGIGDTGIDYIRTRVFEEMAGVTTEKEVLTEAMAHGLTYEIPALQHLGRKMNLQWIVTQRLIFGVNPRFASTPDALVVRWESADEKAWDASSVEVKCFQPAHHMECIECMTPQQLKAIDKKTYWQVLDQMSVCDCLTSYAVFYHPDLPVNQGGLHVIQFDKMQRLGEAVVLSARYPIKNDLDLLEERKRKAVQLMEERLKRLHSI